MSKRLIILIVTVAILAAPLLGCAKSGADDKFRLGVQLPLTGDIAYIGEGCLRTMQWLVEEQNKQGGFLGKQIELIVEDDKGDPKEGALTADKIKARKPHAVLGSYSSTVTQAIQPIYAEAKILHIAPTSSANVLTARGYPTFVRVCWPDERQGAWFAKWLKKYHPDGSKLAFIHDNSAALMGIADATRKYMEQEQGYTDLGYMDSLNPQDKDFTPMVTKLKGMDLEVIYVGLYHSAMGLFVKQYHELGGTAQLVLADEYSSEVVKIAGPEAVQDVYILTAPTAADMPYESAKAFNERYKAKFGEYPDYIVWPLQADGFYVLKAGVEGANSFDGQKVADWIKNNLKDYQGAFGPIDGWDQNGERLSAPVMMYGVDKEGGMVVLPPDKQV